jgi:hypothetical protein
MLHQAIEKIPNEKWHEGICEREPVDPEAKLWFFSLTTYHIVGLLIFMLTQHLM